MARAGARVEHLALDRAHRDELLDHRLRAADVPRRGGGQAVRQSARRGTSPRSGSGSVDRSNGIAGHGSAFTSCSTGTRGPVKNGVSSRVCRRASVARSSRIRSTMRSSSGASKARIHS